MITTLVSQSALVVASLLLGTVFFVARTRGRLLIYRGWAANGVDYERVSVEGFRARSRGDPVAG